MINITLSGNAKFCLGLTELNSKHKAGENLCEKTDSANWTLEVGQDINMQGMMEKQSSFEEPRPS